MSKSLASSCLVIHERPNRLRAAHQESWGFYHEEQLRELALEQI